MKLYHRNWICHILAMYILAMLASSCVTDGVKPPLSKGFYFPKNDFKSLP
jgi:hypothetical protein